VLGSAFSLRLSQLADALQRTLTPEANGAFEGNCSNIQKVNVILEANRGLTRLEDEPWKLPSRNSSKPN